MDAPIRPLLSCKKHRSPSKATTGPSATWAPPKTVDTKPSIPFTPRLPNISTSGRGAEKLSTSRTGILEATKKVVAAGKAATTSRAIRPSKGSDHSEQIWSIAFRAPLSACDQVSLHSLARDLSRSTGEILSITAVKNSSPLAATRSVAIWLGSAQMPSGSISQTGAPSPAVRASHALATLLVSGAPTCITPLGCTREANSSERKSAS
ncbi:unannotated protein [freshwater metagenome]|uniref:Unannotated protein n=1 Tax=freshwater metagenome TaxID=449393 RepID=A0A6J7RUP7_9ZZZZ